jgi:fatty-acyl-CoA synthase
MHGFEEVMALGAAQAEDSLARAEAAVRPDDIVDVAYTSGTTGLPKGAMLSHESLIGQITIAAEHLEASEVDRLYWPTPLYHVFGHVTAVLTMLIAGGCLVISDTFEPGQALEIIEREHCTMIYGVPTAFIMMLDHPNFARHDLSSLRTGLIGGSSSPVQLIRDVIEKMGIRGIVSAYGLTEASSCQTMTRLGDAPELVASTVGVAAPFNECGVFDPDTGQALPAGQQGELWVRGPMVMRGYYKKPEETAKAIDKDGWLHTGDLTTMDENGYFSITGRLKDMFIVGGANAYPAEIENFLFQHPKVKQVYVVGVPDHRLGEVCMAFVELKEGQAATQEEIVEFCKGKIANYKIPRYVRFTNDFPLTPTGKVQKFKLREQAIKELGLKVETF